MTMSQSLYSQGIVITLAHGWNWISYPNSEVMDLDSGLCDFDPIENDMIKAQSGYSVYQDGANGWEAYINSNPVWVTCIIPTGWKW